MHYVHYICNLPRHVSLCALYIHVLLECVCLITEWLRPPSGCQLFWIIRYNYKNNRYLPGNNRNVLEHNRQILGELGNSIIGKIKSTMYQCLSTGLLTYLYVHDLTSLMLLVLPCSSYELLL